MITLSTLFATAMLSFITLFPQEQGMSFSGSNNATYLVIQNISNTETLTILETIENQTNIGFNQWDITQGFMGSNTVKQTSGTGIRAYAGNLFSTLTIIATQIFSQNSPVIYAIAIFSTLAGAWGLYLLIRFVRTGN